MTAQTITALCEALQPHEVLPNDGYVEYRVRFPNTLYSWDQIVELGKDNIHRLIQYFRMDERRFKNWEGKHSELMLTRAKMNKLTALKKQAKKKPLFAAYRKDGYFKVGDKVVCFIGNWARLSVDGEKIVESDWAVATVVDLTIWGVTVRFGQKIYDADDCDGDELDFHIKSPRVVHHRDFVYFQQHTPFFHLWVRNAYSGHPVPQSMPKYFRLPLEILE